MAKSLRSKRKMRLRTLKREIAEPHYEKKEALKNTILEAAAEAPKIEVKNSSAPGAMEIEPAAPAAVADNRPSGMETEDASGSLKPKKKIKKRGKSRGRLKKEKHKRIKLKF